MQEQLPPGRSQIIVLEPAPLVSQPGRKLRRCPRIALHTACQIEDPAGARRKFKSSIENISFSGVYLETDLPVAPGEAFCLSFILSGKHFERVPAKVAWAEKAGSRYRCGLAFDERWTGEIKQALLKTNHESILIVEDSSDVSDLLCDILRSAGYHVAIANTIDKAAQIFSDRPFDLIMLDLNLPDGSGLDILDKIRSHRTRFTTPVMILTSDSALESKMTGLAQGADYYLLKPFDPNEVLFTVSALFRRMRSIQKATGIVSTEDIQIDPDTHVVKLKDAEIANLTPKEFDLLYHLVASRPKVLSKDHIMSKIWRSVVTDNAVEVCILHIRAKLGQEAARRLVTVAGKGYKFI